MLYPLSDVSCHSRIPVWTGLWILLLWSNGIFQRQFWHILTFIWWHIHWGFGGEHRREGRRWKKSWKERLVFSRQGLFDLLKAGTCGRLEALLFTSVCCFDGRHEIKGKATLLSHLVIWKSGSSERFLFFWKSHFFFQPRLGDSVLPIGCWQFELTSLLTMVGVGRREALKSFSANHSYHLILLGKDNTGAHCRRDWVDHSLSRTKNIWAGLKGLWMDTLLNKRHCVVRLGKCSWAITRKRPSTDRYICMATRWWVCIAVSANMWICRKSTIANANLWREWSSDWSAAGGAMMLA